MSEFYGIVKGNRGEATRCGNRFSGMYTIAASWKGAIRVNLYEEDGVIKYRVARTPWHNKGDFKILAEGILE